MKSPTKVNCIVFSFGYAESARVPSFIFSTDFFGIKDYSPEESIFSLANDWYHWYLEQLDHRKKMLVLKNFYRSRDIKLDKAIMDVWNYCKDCCRQAHELNKSYCDCKCNLQIEPSSQDFYDFLTLDNNPITDGFWGEYMLGHTPSWWPFSIEDSLRHIINGSFLSLPESTEDIFIAALRDSGKYPDIFNAKSEPNAASIKILIDDIVHDMERL